MTGDKGIVIRGASDIVVNGTYYLVNDNSQQADIPLTSMNWLSADELTQVMYRHDVGYEYITTADVTVANKNYYIFNNETNEYTLATGLVFNSQIIAGMYYERVSRSGWVVSKISDNTALFFAPVEGETVPPYGDGAQLDWYQYGTNYVEPNMSVTYWDETSFITNTVTSEPDENGTVTVVTTRTNVITGDVYKETNIITTKVQYDVKPLARFDNINLVINKVYKFEFVSDFKQLGYDSSLSDEEQSLTAGVYRIDKITRYLDMVASGIDLYANLYQPCKVPKDVYYADIDRISDTAIYRLVDPMDESRVFYMPQIFIDKTPDASVEMCDKHRLIIDLGIHGNNEYVYYDKDGNVASPSDDPTIVKKRVRLIDDLAEFISQVVEKKWGIKVGLTDLDSEENAVSLETTGTLWLTPRQQNLLEAERIRLCENSSVNFETLFNLDKNNIYYRENLRLRGRIKALEDIAKTMSEKIKTFNQ